MLASLYQIAATAITDILHADTQNMMKCLKPVALLALVLARVVQTLVWCAYLVSIASTRQDCTEVYSMQGYTTVLSRPGGEEERRYCADTQPLKEYLALVSRPGEDEGSLQGEPTSLLENVYCFPCTQNGNDGALRDNDSEKNDKANDNNGLTHLGDGSSARTDISAGPMNTIHRRSWQIPNRDMLNVGLSVPIWHAATAGPGNPVGLTTVNIYRRLQAIEAKWRQRRRFYSCIATDAGGGAAMQPRGAVSGTSITGQRNGMRAHGRSTIPPRDLASLLYHLTRNHDVACTIGCTKQRHHGAGCLRRALLIAARGARSPTMCSRTRRGVPWRSAQVGKAAPGLLSDALFPGE